VEHAQNRLSIRPLQRQTDPDPFFLPHESRPRQPKLYSLRLRDGGFSRTRLEAITPNENWRLEHCPLCLKIVATTVLDDGTWYASELWLDPSGLLCAWLAREHEHSGSRISACQHDEQERRNAEWRALELNDSDQPEGAE